MAFDGYRVVTQVVFVNCEMPNDAGETLRTAVSWGRYAELFAYDEQGEAFSLENPGESRSCTDWPALQELRIAGTVPLN